MRALRILFLLFITIILLFACIKFFVNTKNVSIPYNYQEIMVQSIDNDVDIYMNEHGIAHIVSANDADLFWGMGYLHAQSKLWRMCLNLRIAKGEAAEILGEKYLQSDFYMRAIDINHTAQKIYRNISYETKQMLEKYADGVNTYINANRNRLPVEFAANDHVPELWQPVDCIILLRYFAFTMSQGFLSDVIIGEIADKIGVDKALEFVPNYPATDPFVLDEKINIKKSDEFPELDSIKKTLKIEGNIFAKCRDLSGITNNINYLHGKYSTNIGSNCLAVRKKNDNNVINTVLANDVHSQLDNTANWQQLHISSPNYNVVGLTIPGMPVFFCGRNNDIAWGLANMMLDDVDFFIEKIDEKNEKFFINDNTTETIVETLDTIKVKNSEERVFFIRNTNTSRIISDFHILNNNNYKSTEHEFGKNKKYAITFRWCGNEISDEYHAMLKTMRAKNWNDFLAGVNGWSAPGIVFSYADKRGNIGIAPRGIVPIRGKSNIPTLPVPAWQSDAGWNGFYPASAFPTLYNPEKGFVAGANNAVVKNVSYYISAYWATSSRASRIEEILIGGEYFAGRDAQYLQNDVLSYYAKTQLEKIMYIFQKYEHLLNSQEKKAYYKLFNWDYVMAANSTASSIYNSFLSKLIYNTFADELGNDLYESYINSTNYPLQKINNLLDNPLAELFNNIQTGNREHLEYLVIRSFKDAVADLTVRFGSNNSDKWKYGKLHTLTISNLYNINNRYLSSIATLGPFELGGNSTTLNCTEWKLNAPFKVTTGASMRFIADMNDSLVYTILAGGNSNDVISPNYSDQLQLWHIGAYLSIPIALSPNNEFHLRIKIKKYS